MHAHEVVEGDAQRHGAVAELESVEGVDACEHEVLLHENAEVGLDVGSRVGKLLGRDAHVDELGWCLSHMITSSIVRQTRFSLLRRPFSKRRTNHSNELCQALYLLTKSSRTSSGTFFVPKVS